MKKLSIVLFSLIALTACQSSPESVRNSAAEDKTERAASSSRVSIEVKDASDTVVPSTKALINTETLE